MTVHLPRGVDESDLRQRATSEEVAIGNYRDYWAEPATAPAGLLIGFGSISTDDLPVALARLDHVLQWPVRGG